MPDPKPPVNAAQPTVTAKPAVYIDVLDAQGNKQIMEIGYARDLHQQLGLALASLTQPEDPETAQSDPPQTPDAPDQEGADESPSGDAEPSDPGA